MGIPALKNVAYLLHKMHGGDFGFIDCEVVRDGGTCADSFNVLESRTNHYYHIYYVAREKEL
jgi:hypothetical protein